MWVQQNTVRVMILIRSLITILSPQRSSLRWTRNDFNLLRPSIFQQTQIYSLQKGKQTQIDWKCKFIKFETQHISLGLELLSIHGPLRTHKSLKSVLLHLLTHADDGQVCQPPGPRVPLVPRVPRVASGQAVCPAVPESALCEAAGWAQLSPG